MKNDLGESVDGMAGFPGIGCLQALEAIKIASAVGEPLSGRMLLFDAFFHGFVLSKSEEGLWTVKFTPLKLNLLPIESRISSKEYSEKIRNKEPRAGGCETRSSFRDCVYSDDT
ncbi:hypothetical protein L6164_029437 [Bauhinia variegata]|uniref:Uncharacterized protein n=1 Tax=Bauhinia variegata TaxID=167791 RepID=A0ACB9L9R0_BAUVA|nr:hypothetical protein L6164_029437 [Bauhinia variegata]